MKYEIELISFPGYHFQSEIAMLTGLDLEDILPVTKDITRWSGSTYVKVIQQLGYSCNPRFVKFDKDTPYPCLMRTRKPKVTTYWYGWVYYDGKIYCPHNYDIMTWAEWNAEYPNYKITSMLQVWI